MIYTVDGDVVYVQDGDTCVIDLQLGWWVVRRAARIRVLDLWSPELRPDMREGWLARDKAMELLPVGSRVRVTSALKPTFERTLATIELPDGQDFATLMIAAGHGTAKRT